MTSTEAKEGHASPYSTGGGGTVLEHAYGGALLAALLQQWPVRGLGDDVAPVEVRFQQSASYPVDDLVVVGQCATGTRTMFVGVRRDPTIGASSTAFVDLMVDFLRMVVGHRAELDADRWRLGLAVAGPHTAAREVAELARIARRQRDSSAFSAAVAAPRAVNGKVRARLRSLDDVVAAASAQGGIPLAGDAARDKLTWRLLRALRIIDLRLEGDDPADRTSLVAGLVPLVGDAARAADLWRHLIDLSSGYAQAAATIDGALLHRDLASRIYIGPSEPASLDPAVDMQALRERLAQLPPACAPRLLTAWRDESAQTWRLVTALTSIEVRPAAVVREWQQCRPRWLDEAAWQVQVAAGELATGYGAARLAADLFVTAAAQGATRRSFWLARAAILYDEVGHSTERAGALVALGSSATASEPYARAVAALLAADTDTASRELARWSPDSPIDRTIRAALRLRLAATEGGEAVFDRAAIDRGLRVLAEALHQQWSAGLAIMRARLLIIRARRGESPSWDADLREARTLAMQARDDRRGYRGKSTEAVELACQAAVLTMDLRGAIALGIPGDDGATPEEAASSVVREYVAVAAIQLGNLDLARNCASHVTDQAARARLGALLTEAAGGDPQPHWRRAIELAGDNDEYLAQALAGLAGSGAEELPRFEEFATCHPDSAIEIRAMSELATGKAGAAIARLRTRRRTSVTAALNLAQAYQAMGNVDDQVRTLRDAADDFRDPSLRYSAAEVLARADRPAEAERELDALLAATTPDWNGRPDALRLAAQLAYDDRRYDRACDLLHTTLKIEPDHTGTRWALIRILVHRGDLGGAWRVLSAAPQPLEPSNIADARLWIQLHRRRGQPEETVAGCLRLLRRFSDSEQFSALVITNLMVPWTPPAELPDSLLAEARLEVDRFFDRWPTSRYLRRPQAADVAQLVAEMSGMVRPTDEEQLRLRRLTRGLLLGHVPLSLLAAVAGRSYAEVVVRRGGTVLPARHPDPAEIAACVDAVRAAADDDIVIDTAAVAVLLTLPGDVRQAAMSTFARVITTDDTMLDALAGSDSLALRSTDTWVYDERLDGGRFDGIPQAEANRLAEEASALLSAVEALARYPRPAARSFDDPEAPALNAWASVVDLASDRRIAVWSDDPVLRAIARQAGLRATSTPAVLDHLAHRRIITTDQHESAIRALLKARVGDMPFDEQRLLELAEDDNWAPGCVAPALGRPAAWADIPRAAALFGRLTVLSRSRQPEAIPHWLYQAVLGASAANPGGPASAADIAARLLTITIHASRAQGRIAADLVTATRAALAQADDPDLPPSPDPLPACAVLLRHAYAKAISHALATRYVIATFASLPKADRDAIVRTLLR